ncbi:MAG: monofunctional biosynthetic peptidoglycan transglycosylase [Pseudomonadota bacterium]
MTRKGDKKINAGQAKGRKIPQKPTAKKQAPRTRRQRALRAAMSITLVLLIFPIVWVMSYWIINPPTNYYMIRESLRLGGIDRNWRDIEEMSPHLPRAAMAAEDANFCDHWGFDLEAIEKALQANEKGRRLRGGSTITQQVAKNTFLWPERSWTRKGLEAGFTVLLEALWSKRRIIEIYLNVAEFDEGVFGVQAASQHYFRKDASDLTAIEAARLAAVLPNPKERSASRPGNWTRRRAASIAGGAETLRLDARAECVSVSQGT